MTLEKEDICGKYVIDKSYFEGKNADWQFEHFSFEITKEHDFFFMNITITK